VLVQPKAEKKIGAKFTGESCKCTHRQNVNPQAEQEFMFEEIGGDLDIWTVGVDNLVDNLVV